MKINKSRKALISSKVNKKLRSGVIPRVDPAARLKFKDNYTSEASRAVGLVNKKIKPLLPLLIAPEEAERLDFDLDVLKRFNDVFRAIFIDYFGGIVTGGEPNTALYGRKFKRRLKRSIDHVDKNHKQKFEKTFKRLTNVEPLKRELGLETALELSSEYNVTKITTLSKEYFEDIRGVVFNGLRSGSSNASLIDEVEKAINSRGEDHKASAELIATDQVQKLNSSLDKVRQQSNGGQRYIWRTRRNDRVRSKANSSGYSDHKILEGAIFTWGKPPKTVYKGKRADETNEPGQDINCKCQAEMAIDDVIGKRSALIIEAEKKTKALYDLGIVDYYYDENGKIKN